MKSIYRIALGLGLLYLSLLTTHADGIPIIDAHSQLPAPETAEKVIELMDNAGVVRTILSFRGTARRQHLLKLAAAYPNRITPSIKTKRRHWPIRRLGRGAVLSRGQGKRSP